MSGYLVHKVRPLGRDPQTRLGVRTLCMAMAVALFAAPLAARADCPAAPLTSTDDMVVSFLAGQGGTQAAPSTQFASAVKEGMLVYDDTNNALKVCNGTSWQTLAVGGAGVTAAGTVNGAVQFRGTTGNLEADDVNFVWDDTNNRLGIGTANPSNTITLRDASPSLGLFNTTSVRAAAVGLLSGTAYFYTTGADDVQISANGFSPQLSLKTAGNIGIGTASPNASALVDISSTAKGFLPPRMTTAEATAIATPADGLLVYDTDTDTIKLRANGAWVDLLAGTGSEADPQVGTLTANKWCAANAGGTAIDCTADAPATGAAGSASEVQFRNSGTGAFAADSTFVWDDTNDRLGVGTAAPDARLSIVGDNTSGSNINITKYDGGTPGFIFQSAEGVIGSPTATISGRQLAAIGGKGHDGTAFTATPSAVMRFITDEAFTASAHGTSVVFETTPVGSTTASRAERMRITGAGNVGIGTTTPSTLLHVSGPQGYLQRWTGGTGTAFMYEAAGGNFEFGTAGAQALSLSTNTVRRLYINSAGNVGIGTVSPGAYNLFIDETDANTDGRLMVQGTGDINAAGVSLKNADSARLWDVTIRADSSDDLWFSGYDGSTWRTPLVLSQTGNVGIGTVSPGTSALLDLTSTNRGFLPPRMTTAQRDAIATPATGLVVYNTDTNALNYYDGTAWAAVGPGGGSGTGQVARASGGSVSISNEVWTTLDISSAAINVGSIVDTTTDRITPTESGYYLVSVTTSPTTALSDQVRIGAGIYVNGGVILSTLNKTASNSTDDQHAIATTVVYLDGNDYIEARGYHKQGTTQSMRLNDISVARVAAGGGGGSSQWTTAGSDIYYNTGGVAVGTNAPNTSALLDVSSTSKGFLPPRMTTAQRDAIASPTAGLSVYNTDKGTTDVFTTATGFGAAAWEVNGGNLRALGRGTSGSYDTITGDGPGGIWWMDGPGSTQGPTGTNTGTLVHLDPLYYSAGTKNKYAIQLATAGNSAGKLYFREQYNGTWGSWVDLTGGGSSSSPAFVAYHSANFSVTANSFTEVAWNSTVFNTNSNYNTANGRFTPSVAGRYVVSAHAYLQSCGAGSNIAIYKNGGTVLAYGGMTDANWRSGSVTTVADMNGSTDYLSAFIYCAGGTTIGGTLGQSQFSAALLGGGGGGGGSSQWADGASSSINYTAGNVGIGTATPASKLHVAGGIQLGDDTATCPGASNVKVGTLRYNAGALNVCTLSGWSSVGSGGGGGNNAAPTISFTGGGTLTVTLASGMALYQSNSHTVWSSYGTLPSYLVGARGTDTVNGTPDGSAVTLTITGGSALCYQLRNESGWAGVDTTGWSIKAQAPADFTSFNPGIDIIRERVFPPGSYTLDTYSAMYACSTAPVGGGSPGGADTQVQFNDGGAFAGDASFVWDKTNKRLGIGVATPAYSLEVVNAGSTPAAAFSSDLSTGSVASGGQASILVRNTDVAATALGGIQFYANDTTSVFRHGASIMMGKAGAWTGGSGDYPGFLSFYTRASSSNQFERMRIDKDGNVGIGTTTPSGTLDMRSASGATRLYLGANDTQEKVIHFRTQVNGVSQTPYIRVTNSGTLELSKVPSSDTLANGGTGVFLDAGSSNAGIPYWQGWHFAAPTVTEGGLNRFGRASHYWSYTSAADPTDLYYNINLGNVGGLVAGIALDTENGGPILLKGGNVGIGTTAPAAKLDVAGAINTSSSITATGGITSKASFVLDDASSAANVYMAPYDGTTYSDLRLYTTKYNSPSGSINDNFWRWLAYGGSHATTANRNDLRVMFYDYSAGTATSRDVMYMNGADSYVGFGVTNPTYRVQLPNTASVAGRGQANSWVTYSDGRFKADVTPISDALDKVSRLQGITYRSTQDGRKSDVTEIGFIAQDVEKIVPEVVSVSASRAKRADGTEYTVQDYRSLDYARLTALLAEAVKELKAANDNLKSSHEAETRKYQREIQQLKAANDNLESENEQMHHALDELRIRVENLEYGK